MNKTTPVFGYPETLVKEYDHWVVMVRPHQVTLGTLVIASKSEVIRLGELTSEEWAEFAIVTNEMESLLTKTFGAEKFNYLALMMKDPNPHFHLVPRYSKPIDFGGRQWIDNDWPGKTELRQVETTEGENEAIINAIRANL